MDRVEKYVEYPEYYDFDSEFKDDIPFYLKHAGLSGGAVLELACGTGRILIPMAIAGLKIYGIDISDGMLNICRQKIKESKTPLNAHIQKMDMADFNLAEKDFSFIFIAFRSFMHLFSQEAQLSCLRNVYRHLRPGGKFIVDLYAPVLRLLTHERDGEFELRREFTLANNNRVERWDRYLKGDIVKQLQRCEMRFAEYSPAGELLKEKILPMITRYTFPYEMQLLLEKVGFTVEGIYRDYDENKYDGTGEMLTVCTKPM
ncbi:methyltransferase domain-containing protein [Candidatus Riflebacteria bacterium]